MPLIGRKLRLSLVLAGLLLCLLTGRAQGNVVFNVSFDDPTGEFSSFYDQITSNTVAAGQHWASHLAGAGSLEVLIRFEDLVPTATGSSVTNRFVRNNGSLDLYEPGATHEIRTGSDPNEGTHDIEFTLGSFYLTQDLWFDPDPAGRLTPVPLDKVDAVSVFLHEFGHAFAFTGFRNPVNGDLPGTFGSTFDEFVTFDGMNLFFNGAQAVDLYGGPVPLTFGNYLHFANAEPRPGSDLIPDLMNGVSFFRGTRYGISDLDLALFADVGVPLAAAIPEPSTLALCSVGLLMVFAHQRARRRRLIASSEEGVAG